METGQGRKLTFAEQLLCSRDSVKGKEELFHLKLSRPARWVFLAPSYEEIEVQI